MGHERDFLTVGSMGHAASLALGIALKKPNRQVYIATRCVMKAWMTLSNALRCFYESVERL